MNKNIYTTIASFLLTMTSAALAQKAANTVAPTNTAPVTAEQVWKEMPDSLLPYFNATARSEIIDTYKINKEAKTKNLLGGESQIKQMDSNSIYIQLNAATTMQLALLPTSDSTSIVCTVKTFGTTAQESEINFFTTNWQPIESNFGLPDFSNRGTTLQLLTQKPDSLSQEKFNKLTAMFEPATVSARLAFQDTPTITFCINAPLLTKEEKEELKCITLQKTFKWKEKIFK